MDNSVSIVAAFTAIWSEVADWFIELLLKVPDIFYSSSTGLTFIGTLAIFSAGFGLIMLVIGMIRSWIKRR